MSASSATGRGAARPPRRPAKVIRMPTPRLMRRRRAAKIGSAILAVSLAGMITLRMGALHTTRVATDQIASPLSGEEFRILKLVNDERVRVGQPPLQFSPRLMAAARIHSQDMAEHGYLGHDSPAGDTPSDRVHATGVTYEELGENLHRDDRNDLKALPERAIGEWLANPHYRARMLSARFRLAGVGIARSSDGQVYVTEDFIR